MQAAGSLRLLLVVSSGNGGAQIPKANIAATPTFSPTGLEFPTGIHSPASANEETSSASNVPGKPSYANVNSEPSGTKVNFHTLYTPGGNEIDVVVPFESIRAISEGFPNTAYGFFWKRVAYPVVANYVRNTCDVNLLKENVGTVLVWVNLHGVPVMVFSENGLSVITTKLDTLIMLDSYTTDMCIQSLGRSSYARDMIELRADMELKDNIMAVMPKMVMKAILVDNEGKPVRKVDDDSEDEVASIDNEMASFLAKDDGFGTQSLLEQWKDSHDDYEYDPYDDDLYEGQKFRKCFKRFVII
nr:hypothetical protein [Tanacetum cinerariifolium]